MKSFIAEPSLRNSGFEATSNFTLRLLKSFTVCSIHSPVLTGTVDFSTMSLYDGIASAIWRETCSM